MVMNLTAQSCLIPHMAMHRHRHSFHYILQGNFGFWRFPWGKEKWVSPISCNRSTCPHRFMARRSSLNRHCCQGETFLLEEPESTALCFQIPLVTGSHFPFVSFVCLTLFRFKPCICILFVFPYQLSSWSSSWYLIGQKGIYCLMDWVQGGVLGPTRSFQPWMALEWFTVVVLKLSSIWRVMGPGQPGSHKPFWTTLHPECLVALHSIVQSKTTVQPPWSTRLASVIKRLRTAGL